MTILRNKMIVNFIILLIVFFPSWALAHNVTLMAYEENGIVYCESFYHDGRPAENGNITVTTQEGTIVKTGKANKSGMFQFNHPGGNELQIRLDTLMGHSDTIILTRKVKRETALLQKDNIKPGLSKVLLGVCAILGFFGITAYLINKRNKCRLRE